MAAPASPYGPLAQPWNETEAPSGIGSLVPDGVFASETTCFPDNPREPLMQYFREPVSGLTHLAGALLGVAGLVWLITLTQDDPAKMISMIVYGVSLILLYSASAALHLIKGSERTILWLCRFDHAAIYALIAGTYTPICYNV